MKLKMNRVVAAKALTALATIGVGVTALIAIRKGDKVRKAVEDARKEIADESSDEEKKPITKLEVAARYVARVAPVSAPIIVSCVVTDGLIIAAQALTLKEVAVLSGTVGYLIANRDALRKQIEQLPGGKEALEKVDKEVATARAKASKKNIFEKKDPWKHPTVEDTGNGDLLCMDGWSGRLFRSSQEAVEEALNEFNAFRDNKDGYTYKDGSGIERSFPSPMAYNDLFTLYGIEPSQQGFIYGWPADDDWYEHREIPFEVSYITKEEMQRAGTDKYGEDMLIIEIPSNYFPIEGWQEI